VSGADDAVVIRRAEAGDLQALGRLGASMIRLHHAFDEHRFIGPGADPEDVYRRFLDAYVTASSALILVAERPGSDAGAGIVGYVFAAIEPASFKELRDRAGYIHDLLIADDARGAGVGPRLLEAAVAWLREQGMPRVLLWTAAQNARARKLFEAHGFSATMVEMTRELE
jgi:GNAT superfamily N-acetyltransferase